jgi:tetratricopeptide (TPR) repeat protein
MKLGIWMLAAAGLAAQPMDPLVREGFDHFYNVEYPEAIASFRKAVQAAPSDPNRHNHLAQAVLFGMMFRVGALESEMVTGGNPFLRRPKMEPTAEEEKLFREAIAACLDLTAERLQKNPDDAGAMYARGVALGLRGTYGFLVRKAWLDALRDVTAGRKLHNRVSQLKPEWIDARMMQGVHDYIVGSLPFGYRLLGFLAGFHGDREAGIRTLRLVAEKGEYAKVDAEILLGVVYRRERRPREVIPILESLLERFPRNFLVLFELSQMYADLGEKENALRQLDRIEELKARGLPGFKNLPLERIEYARGNLLFWYNEFDRAIGHLRKATARAQELDPNAATYSWLRLGQCYDLTGRRSEAVKAYQAAQAVAPSSEPGREARRYASKPFTAAIKKEIDERTRIS